MAGIPAGDSTSPDSLLASTFSPGQVQDLASMLRHLGVQSLRASVVDMTSMMFQAAWSVTDGGELGDGHAERPLDSVFPAGSATIQQLGRVNSDETRAQRLSPRRWVFAWRFDEATAVVGEAQFHARRDEVSEIDTALIRLVCNASIRGGVPAAPAPERAARALDWPPGAEPRGRVRPRPSTWIILGLLVSSGLLAAWLTWGATPPLMTATLAQQAEIKRLADLSDGTLVHGLSLAAATGDYGEVQTALSSLASLGYFRSAVVTNVRDRIVALAGPVDHMRIGDAVSPEYAQRARSLDLALGSQRYGRVAFIAATPPDSGAARIEGLRWGALGAGMTSLAAAALIVRRLLRARR